MPSGLLIRVGITAYALSLSLYLYLYLSLPTVSRVRDMLMYIFREA